jgi:hypothetical protein
MTVEQEQAGSPAPTLSVVVASSGDRARLESCLEALREASAAWLAELIVTLRADAAEVNALAARHPQARFLTCPPGASVAELRAAGMRAAGGDIVALVEDGNVPAGDWLGGLVSGYRQRSAKPAGAACGPRTTATPPRLGHDR